MELSRLTLLAKRLETSATGVAILDDQNTLVYANAGFAQRLQVDDPESLRGQAPIPAWTHGASADERAALGRQLQEPEACALTLGVAQSQTVTLYFEARQSTHRIVVAATGWPKPDADDGLSVALIDPLTGLGNRSMYDRLLEAWVAGEHTDPDASIAVIAVDLDRFKQVNDTLGHGSGDDLLKLAAKRMRAAVRGDDAIIRLGGDEFAIVQAGNKQPDGARSAAARLVSLMQRPFLIEGQQVNTGASVGVAVLGQGTDEPAQLLQHADLALYEAKRLGRSQYCFFEPQLESRARERREFEVDLRRALGLRQFSLVYQPQKSFSSERISGFEALIRWHHPRRGLVSPAQFIPAAEDLGEIHQIGAWVLRTACKQATQWSDDLSVAVNISPIQFENPEIVKIVRETLASTGLAPARLELEITESTLMGNSEVVMERLWAIKEMGVGIAMDDFGTGYASLSYLHSFPFSKLKIDQSFIQAEQSPRSKALIDAILAMGTSLGMATIAEGVETPAQYAELASGGCATAQGYYISRPMPPEEIDAFLGSLAGSESDHPPLKRVSQ